MENYTLFVKMWIQFPKDVNIPKISYKHKIIPIQPNVTNLSRRTELIAVIWGESEILWEA